MKIKKSQSAAQGGAGGATIADRFKLDAVASGPAYKGPTVGRTASLCALIAGAISLALIAALTYVLGMHWDYLMPA